ncbi:acyltransferase-like protein, chloroplastic isoform X2 [Iris pallida]|uniref:Acyltransferase-like protein, chloroplastic isoform X2 n=1 Tax=Iris pallida TaxID=29817 RepID=A0AAX6I7B1_IRIPA|nr:acyltransferase-like protein, chloroplastic isoform X2 [Iris pallida]KAJ6854055.1 acyltransferase-like protein, chloroplastic isoform X2 [Iris pallida]
MSMAAACSSFPLLLPLSPAARARNGSRFRVVASASVGEAKKDKLHYGEEDKKVEEEELAAAPFGGLSVLYDDGFGTKSVKDYFAAAKEITKPDGGPPRWFCPAECGQPIEGSPVLMFLPGVDGTGMGLTLHQKPLGKVFEVRCLHIPVNDRTPFEGLVKFVETSVKHEHSLDPSTPIYLVGDSFGGCLALAVSARNPSIDLVLILINPATSYNKSQLQPFVPALEALPRDLHTTVPYILSLVMGDPVKMAMASIIEDLSPQQILNELSKSLTSMLPLLSDLSDILPKDTLLWKLELLKSGTAYANSRLHAVEAEVLVLASGKDNMLPSGSEADRLRKSLKNCSVRYFKDNGHTLLLEDGLNLLSVIKGASMYRRSNQHDFVTDYLPPTKSEFRQEFDRDSRLFSLATSPVLFSTLENGKIVRGLGGIPDKGPVLFVGYHMLMGLELGPLGEAFLREKNIIIRGMAHPILFTQRETPRQEMSRFDLLRIFGAVPVSPTNMYRLLSRKSFVLLYPGGAREALHRKGEEYKLYWPDQPEFVRMAARFDATIVPFGVVGEDDIAEVVLDYDDQMNIPFVQRWIESMNQGVTRLRTDTDGEVAKQDLYLPVLLPKVPGRFYYLFGKPFETRGMNILKDRESANKAYTMIKSETESLMSYLLKKREEDPYRNVVQRTIYQNSWGPSAKVPTFDP